MEVTIPWSHVQTDVNNSYKISPTSQKDKYPIISVVLIFQRLTHMIDTLLIDYEKVSFGHIICLVSTLLIPGDVTDRKHPQILLPPTPYNCELQEKFY